MVATKRFYRSRQNKMVAGVAMGLAQYFNVDPVLFRLAFVILGFVAAPFSIGTYILLTIVMPERPEGEPEPLITSSLTVGNGREIAGIALVGLGLVVLAANMGVFAFIRWDLFWPLLMVAAGAALVVSRIR